MDSAQLQQAVASRYSVERELGRGGMASVYLARDEKHGRPVAIKVLHPELARLIGSERFLREIRIAAGLAHPHILPLIDSGEADSLLYYVTPYAPDGSLRERLTRSGGKLPVTEALRVAREVGSALDYAHRQGFVHRDVKPENILFADGHAILADFGMARAQTAVAGGVSVTEAGMAVGTPEYMSPEQAAGQSEVRGASDQYSLACVVYEMLAGEPPLKGAGPRETMTKHVIERARPVRALRPEVPAPLDRALSRALSKTSGERFETVAACVAEMQADTGGSRAGGAHGGMTSAIARGIAVLPFVNASPDPSNEYLSDGITDELINALAQVEGLRVSARTSVFALKNKPQDVRVIGALLGSAWVLEGSVRRSGDRLRITAQLSSTEDGRLLWSERYDRTFEDVFAIEEEIARTIVTTLRASALVELPEPAPVRATGNIQAYGLYLQGRFAWNLRTNEGVTEAIRCFEAAIREDAGYAAAYAGLADAYALQLDYRNIPVAEGFARATAYAQQALALDDRLAEAHASLAWSLFIYGWEWKESGREFRRAIELDPRYATAHQWYGFWLAAHGRLEDAIVSGHTALELDPASVSIRRTMGWIYYYARRFDQARHHLTRAIAMNPTAEESHRALALVLAHEGEWTEAERVLREATTLWGRGAYTMATLAYVLARTGRREEAERVLAGLLAEREAEYVNPVAIATVYLGLEDRGAALDWMERACGERRGWVVYANVNPIFDPLRKEPRFALLRERLGIG